MKTSLIVAVVAFMMSMLMLTFGYTIGVRDGRKQTNEQYYSDILADTFPTQDGSFSHIYLRNGTYYVYNGINESDFAARYINHSYFFDATYQCWENHAIFFRR